MLSPFEQFTALLGLRAEGVSATTKVSIRPSEVFVEAKMFVLGSVWRSTVHWRFPRHSLLRHPHFKDTIFV